MVVWQMCGSPGACSGKGLPGLDPGLHGFADKNMLQLIDLARVRCRGPSVLFAQVIPPERKARW